MQVRLGNVPSAYSRRGQEGETKLELRSSEAAQLDYQVAATAGWSRQEMDEQHLVVDMLTYHMAGTMQTK